MTITEHAPYSTKVDDSYPGPGIEPQEDPVNAGDRNPGVPQWQWQLRRLTTTTEWRPYHHPRRERFVEEAAMSREMFRL